MSQPSQIKQTKKKKKQSKAKHKQSTNKQSNQDHIETETKKLKANNFFPTTMQVQSFSLALVPPYDVNLQH